MSDRIDKICSGVAVVLEVAAFGWYARQVIVGAITPALATWLICAIASTLSLVTYLAANKGEKPVIANIANRVDPVVVWAVAMIIMFSPKSDTRLHVFDVACLAASSFIMIIWAKTHSAEKANRLIQVIMVAGYLPTFYRLLHEGRNTESFLSWSVNLVVSALFLIPPIRKNDSLGKLYAGRAVVSVILVLFTMMYFQFFGPR